MQPITKEDVFTIINTQIVEDSVGSPSSNASFDTFHGLLTAGVLGASFWAALILLYWWLWL